MEPTPTFRIKNIFLSLFIAFLLTAQTRIAFAVSSTCTANSYPSIRNQSDASETNSIQWCINNLTSGGTVELSAGTYYTSGTIIIASDITIRGSGEGSTVIDGSTTSVDIISNDGNAVSDFAIRDVTIRGSGKETGYGQACILFKKVDGSDGNAKITIRNTTIEQCGQYGIHIKDTDGAFITAMTLQSNGTDVEEDHNIYLRNVSNALVEDSTSYYATGNGFNVACSDNVVIQNVTANYNGQNGIRFAASENVAADTVTASYNGYDNGTGDPDPCNGIVADGSFDNLCNGIELRTESADCDDRSQVNNACVENSTANNNYSFWFYSQTATNYHLDNNSKNGNRQGGQNCSIDSTAATDEDADDKCVNTSTDPDPNANDTICGTIPTDSTAWPFTRTSDNDGDGQDGTADDGDDCRDDDTSIYTGAPESCNNTDDDCDGSVDEEVTRSTTCGIGACAGSAGVETCTTGTWGGDTCNPTANAVTENCNGIDDDCDGSTDESDAADPITWYADGDGDGFGNASNSQASCAQPTGYVTNNTDCSDSDPTVYPGAPEACGENKNCDEITVSCDTDGDGLSDSDEVILGTSLSDPDSDDDGLNDGDEVGLGTDPTDTDSDNDSFSDYIEVQNGTNPLVYDDVITPILDLLLGGDDDGDTYDSTDDGGEDCVDDDATIHPGASETCGDGIDQDCSGADTSCDSDSDGYTDDVDLCPLSIPIDSSDTINSDGCALSELDTDSDGLTNYDEIVTYACDPDDVDSDDDSLNDYQEVVVQNTDPNDNDTDGDQLQDGWEVTSINGINLRSMGANPRKKDLFVEIDWMKYPGASGHNHKPTNVTVSQVVSNFASLGSLTNPDGTTGVALHLDTGGLGGGNQLTHDDDLTLWTEFDAYKSANFSSSRSGIFHYVIYGHKYNGGCTNNGTSRDASASDVLIAMGCTATQVGSTAEQSQALTRELRRAVTGW